MANPDSTLFHLPFGVRLRGRLRYKVLERSLTKLLRRHDILRTVIADRGGHPGPVVLDDVGMQIPISRSEVAPRLEGEDWSVFDFQVLEELRRPFDLARGPLLRARLLELGLDDHILLFTLHRLAGDAWSASIVLRELEQVYAGFAAREPTQLPPRGMSHAQHAAAQRRWLASEESAQQLAYWVDRLAGLAPRQLPTQHPRQGVRSTRVGHVRRHLERPTRDALHRLAQGEGASLAATLLAGLCLGLGATAGTDEVAVSTHIGGRMRPSTAATIGPLANTIVVRASLAGNPSYRDMMHRIERDRLAGLHQAQIPHELVLAAIRPGSAALPAPLCPVAFTLLPSSAAPATGDDRQLQFEPLLLAGEESIAELHLTAADRPDGIHHSLAYATELFDASSAGSVLDRVVAVLKHAASQPEARASAILDDAGGSPGRMAAPLGATSPVSIRLTSPCGALIPLLTGAEGRPVFLVPGGSGSASMLAGYARQFQQLDLGRPVHGFLATEPLAAGDGHAWVDATAAAYVREMRALQPDGPYLIIGSCVGGVLAMAMAQHLYEAGICTPHVVLIDARHPRHGVLLPAEVWRDLTPPPPLPRPSSLSVGGEADDELVTGEGADSRQDTERYFERVLYVPRLLRLAEYAPRPYPGEVTLFANRAWLSRHPALGWAPPAVGKLHLHELSGDHEGHMLDNIEEVGRLLRPLLTAIEAAG